MFLTTNFFLLDQALTEDDYRTPSPSSSPSPLLYQKCLKSDMISQDAKSTICQKDWNYKRTLCGSMYLRAILVFVFQFCMIGGKRSHKNAHPCPATLFPLAEKNKTKSQKKSTSQFVGKMAPKKQIEWNSCLRHCVRHR